MAERPVFVPCATGSQLVGIVPVSFKWNPGFAAVQKRKNVTALHEAAAAAGYSPILEVSSKSETKLGQRLSAFSLVVKSVEYGEMPLEAAFQGSKVFERGGPYIDIYSRPAKEARKDPRLRSSGRVVAFRFDGNVFPTRPKTAFYDWLYITTLFPHREFLERLKAFAGFTDIEFNPQRSINCQARSCATMVAMMERGILEQVVKTPGDFVAAASEALDDEVGTAEDEQRRIF